MEERSKEVEEIEKLCKKADQTRSIHSMMRDDIVLINNMFVFYVTVGSAISAMLIFAPIPVEYQKGIGIFLASVFIASIIPSTFNFNSQILERTMAIQSWGEWIRDAKSFCDTEISRRDIDSINARHKELLVAYKKVMDKTPLIPDKKFNKYKRLHLQKIAISKELDKNPFKTIEAIKKELSS